MQIEISREYMSKQKLFLATPCFGGTCTGIYAKCIADLSNVCAQLGIQLNIYLLFNESLITRARNYSCDEFMRSDFTHFIFIDADIGFQAMYIIQLMALQTDESPYDIIGAPYPKKCISWEKIVVAVNKGFADPVPAMDEHGKPIVNKDGSPVMAGGPENLNKYVGDYVFNPKNGTQNIPVSEPCEVLEIGTGFMMIKRTAFQKFNDAHPEFLYKPDHVRTEHFDGTRQIMQYFQAEVEQIDFRKHYETKLIELASSGQVTPEDISKVINEAHELNAKLSNRYLSEDYWFCQKAQALELKTWLCPWMELNHTGSMVYGGSLADIASLGVSPTADIAELNKYKKKKVGEK